MLLRCSCCELLGPQQFNCISSAIHKVIHLHLHPLHTLTRSRNRLWKIITARKPILLD